MKKKTILFVHGRSFKPNRRFLRKLWLDAVRFGIKRDRSRKLDAFRNLRKEFVYYGDLSNEFLFSEGRNYDEENDIADRRMSLTLLKDREKDQFTRREYNRLSEKNAVKEFLADVVAAPSAISGLSGLLINAVAPDMKHYWNPDSAFGSDVRARMTIPLRKAFKRSDNIMVVAHSLGTMVAYDTLWKFSRMGDYRDFFDSKINTLVTLGSPLADEAVKKKLRGSGASGERRFPSNIGRWINLAAEDDYISHDQKLANDYKGIRKLGTRLQDIPIYNFAVRNGESNPHSSVGYLIHPKVIEQIADWL